VERRTSTRSSSSALPAKGDPMDRSDRELSQVADEELVDRFVRGDEPAFTELMQRHEDRVFAMAVRITGDRSDALDATQEAFISLYRRAASFRGESSFTTWLCRIALNAAYDVVRKRRPVQEASDDLVEEDIGAEGVEGQVGMRSDIADALAQLPAEYREAVAMHDLADISYQDIAAATGVSLGTVKSRISRGRGRLAELLEPSYRAGTSKEQT
jgi:RNA polymerase sigma-70 factor, ECF subfamily